jgi:hypothetical protein
MRAALDLSPERRLAISLAARQFAADHIGIDAVAGRTMALFEGLSRASSRGHRSEHVPTELATIGG